MKAEFAPVPSEKIQLRPIQLADASLIYRWKNDPVVQQMALRPGASITLQSQQQDIQQAIDSPEQVYLMIELKQTRQAIGYIRIHWMDEEHRSAWLRFALGAERGKGYAHDALTCFLSTLFLHGLHRIEAEVYEFNTASLALLARLGFQREGLKRQAHFDGERYHNILILGLLKEDYYRSNLAVEE
jgi:ribosomal-protein-alanine N-acetyltransferase